jgi:FMN phosphatase YigB (HAD superfamily)
LLIIFDLDDILIKTSEEITPWRFKQVLEYLQRKGITADLDKLLRDHQQYDSSSEALTWFLTQLKLNSEEIAESVRLLNAFDPHIPVSVFDGVYVLLEHLKKTHTLALVTAGSYQIQSLKIQKAKLDKNYFDYIEIVENGDKTQAYQNAHNLFSINPVLVVGDRVSKDLSPAKTLGFETVLVRQGRGVFQKISGNQANHVIEGVTEVENLIKLIHNL